MLSGADTASVVNDSMGALRVELGKELDLVEDRWAPCWVVEWPMFNEARDGSLAPEHHPFVLPTCDAGELLKNPLAAKAAAYDIVLNGYELGGGSLRIHDVSLQNAVFEALNIGQEARIKFGFLLDALKFGCPPHGGIALGMDRLVMLMTGTHAIRDVMAFPKTQSAACLMTDAPSPVDEHQLRELHIRLRTNT